MAGTGVVVALEQEARLLTSAHTKRGVPVELRTGTRLCLSGMGMQRARMAALALVGSGCRVLISWGTVGALDPVLEPAQLFLPEIIHDESGLSFQADHNLLDHVRDLCQPELKVVSGNLLTVDRVVRSISEKQDLRHRYPAVAIDMEAAAVAEVALHHHIPFLAIKTPIDTVDQEFPAWLLSALDPWGHLRINKLVRSLVSIRYGQLALLIRLSRNLRRGQRTLAWVARKTDGLSFHKMGGLGDLITGG